MSYLEDHAWKSQGACVGYPPSWWFPEQGHSSAHAKAICAGCSVIVKCGEYARAEGIRFGVWGGESYDDVRRRARRERAA